MGERDFRMRNREARRQADREAKAGYAAFDGKTDGVGEIATRSPVNDHPLERMGGRSSSQ